MKLNNRDFCYIIYRIFGAISLAFYAGCSTPAIKNTSPEIIRPDFTEVTLFGERPNIPPAAELFELTDQQKEAFLKYFHHPQNISTEPYLRVFEYLENFTYNFAYEAITYPAQKTLSLEQGNCMSLAILTASLAGLANVKTSYQLIDSTPVFEQKGRVVVKGLHVRTKLIHSQSINGQPVSTNKGLIVDYFPGGDRRFLGNVSQGEFISMYYRNIAAESITREEYAKAYWYTMEALKHAPFEHNNLNHLALIFKRVGQVKRAEAIYQYGIQISENKLSLLKNYRSLLLGQNRHPEAYEIHKRITELDDLSPYNWLNIADDAFSRKEYSDALNYYQRAAELAPYLQFPYLGLAKTYSQLEEFEKAKDMLLIAMENNYNRDNHRMYKAKLTQLKSEGHLDLDLMNTQH